MFTGIFGEQLNAFGLDIGYNSVKVIQLKKSGRTFAIKSINLLSIPNNSLTKDGIKESEKISQAIKEAISDSKPQPISARQVITSLPESLIFTKIITSPLIKDSEIADTVRLQISELFPIPIEDLYYDWQVISKNNPLKSAINTKETDKAKKEEHSKENPSESELEILIIGTPKKIVDDINLILQNAGLELVILETKSIASARAILPSDNKKVLVLIDIGAETSNISIFENGVVRFTGTVSCGGNAVTRTLAGISTIPEDTKERQKILDEIDANLSVDRDQKKEDITKTLRPVIDGINQAIKYFQTRVETEDKINRILITGGGANLPYITEILEAHTGYHTGIANPFTNVKQPKDHSLSSFCTYTSALGCALRNFSE